MRIGFDAKRAFFNETGLGNYSRNLINGLIQYYPENEYYLFSPKTKNEKQTKRKKDFSQKTVIIEPESLSGILMPSVWRSFLIKKEIKVSKIDIFHGLSHELPFFLGNPEIRKIVTIHDLIYKKYPSFYSYIDRNAYNYKYKYACRNSDTIIAISESTKKDIINYYSIPEEKIEVVYQSANEAYFRKYSDNYYKSVSKKYSLPKVFMLYVGSFNERKNLLNVIQALSLISEEKIPLLLVGRGKKYKEIMIKTAKNLNVEGLIKIIEDVPNDDLPALYKLALFSVYPSIYEGFGIPVIESLACGTPVLLSKSSSLSEAAGEGGFFCDVENSHEIAKAMVKLVKDAALRKKLTAKGILHTKKFTQKQSAESLMKVYEKVMKMK